MRPWNDLFQLLSWSFHWKKGSYSYRFCVKLPLNAWFNLDDFLPVGMIDLFSDLGTKPLIGFFRLSKQQSICTPRWRNINSDHKMLCCDLLYTVNTQSTQNWGWMCRVIFYFSSPSLNITSPLLLSMSSSQPSSFPSLFFTFWVWGYKAERMYERLVRLSPHLALMLRYCHRGKGTYAPSPI